MEEQRRIYEAFVATHAARVPTTDEPLVHLAYYRGPDAPVSELRAYDRDDVLSVLDRDAELVRWLLNQMTTYDCTRQRIIGLVFDKHTVLSDVLRAHEPCERAFSRP